MLIIFDDSLPAAAIFRHAFASPIFRCFITAAAGDAFQLSPFFR